MQHWKLWNNGLVTASTKAAALITTACLLALSPASAYAESDSQKTFRSLLLKDKETSSSVKRLLEERTAYVNPKIIYGDLTGDGRLDATVRVSSGGAAADIALYVLSSHPRGNTKSSSSKLRVVYRNQSLYRLSSVRVVDGRLRFKTASYRKNDALCCPSRASERELVWHSKNGSFSSRKAN